MNKEVTGCDDCPFHIDREVDECIHPSNSTDTRLPLDSNYDIITPDWCPLKTEPITISIKQD